MSDVAEEFASSLSDLTVNSKPHINMLTMLAEENIEFAPLITQTVLTHLQKVSPEIKLPVLYLIDSIVKNVGKAYIELFTQAIVQHFTDTFEKVDEKTREQMFKLRQTWSDLFSPKTIYALDAKVHKVDPAWPCSAPPSSVHLNPKFFKSDLIESKSLTSTKFQLETEKDSRSRQRKSKPPQYSPRTSSLSHSSRSRKASPTSTTESTEKALGAEALREQMILKQKKLLELQKKKLELELMETKAKLDEQQKQLKQTSSHKGHSAQLAKIQKKVSQEEAQLKLMSKNLKKQVAKNAPKRQEIHRAIIDMKSQKLGDVGKLPPGPDSLLKPAALLELDSKPAKSSVKSVSVPAQPPPKPSALHQALERQKQIVAADSTEEIDPPPVRIAPVSSQLISAALSYGRNVRDPRIRLMSSRLESRLNTMAAPPPVPVPSTPHSTSIPTPAPPAVSKKLSPPQDPRTKHKKDKRSSKEQEKSPKKSEDENKPHHSRHSSRKSDKSPSKSKSEKMSPSKKSEEKKDKKLEDRKVEDRKLEDKNLEDRKLEDRKLEDKKVESKVEELFASPTTNTSDHDIVRNPSKRSKVEELFPPPSLNSSDYDIIRNPSKKSKLEEPLSPPRSKSPDYDIIRNPMKKPKVEESFSPPREKTPENLELSTLKDSARGSDDSVDEKFDYDIIRNPTKYMISDRIVTTKEEPKDTNSEEQKVTISEEQNITTNEEQKFIISEDKKKQLESIFDMPDEESVAIKPFAEEVFLGRLKTEPEVESQSDYIVNEAEEESLDKKENQKQQLLTTEQDFSLQEDTKPEIPHETNNQLAISMELDGNKSDHLALSELPSDIPPQQMPNLSELSEISKPYESLEQVPLISDPVIENPEGLKRLVEADESNKSIDSPIQVEKKSRKGEKPSMMEQLIADAESHEASPSPPPPPVISDKFKEIKQSSLSRLRRVGRPREDLDGPESPEPSDVDLRPSISAPLIKDQKNEVIGLAEKDVDLRSLPASPKKRQSVEKLMDSPPAKKSKAEVMDELFGSEDVDLRPVLCPPPPSPPPPPRISSPPPDTGGEKLWARYKQTRPDTYKSKYTPSPRDRAASVDRLGRLQRFPSTTEGSGRSRTYSEDVDMRTQAPGVSPEESYNQIIMHALEQHKRGDLSVEEYKRVLSEVVSMREKHQLQEAQRRDEEEAAQASEELTEPISDDEVSGGSLSGIENAPSPTDSYSGGEENEELSDKTVTTETDKNNVESKGDVDIRRLPADVDIRMKIHRPRSGVDEKNLDENHSMRALSPYSRKALEKEKYRSRKEEIKAQRREKSRRAEERRQTREERDQRYRQPRFGQEPWEGREDTEIESMEVDVPRVPPLPHFPPAAPPHHNLPRDQLEPAPRLQPPPGPGWNNGPRITGPSGPWAPPPHVRGPPGMIQRPQERFMPPRWRPPGPGHAGEPGPRFNRFGPPGPQRFSVGMPAVEIPPSDPTVLKMIEEDPTKSISIDGLPRDIRFYGITAVAFMAWDDPREVTFQPGHRRVFIDRESIVLHFNAPPQEMIIDEQPHRLRLGAPTRELYIDNQWHEVFFGAPSVPCPIGGQTHMVQLEGPPPQVRPGVQRRDLVVGRIMLIIDAELFFPIFLDAKPQRFEVLGVGYIIRFVEALQTTVINGVPFKSDFGGKPKPIFLNGKKHFFRLSELPRGVIPGYLNIVTMEGGRLPSPPPPQALPAPPLPPQLPNQPLDFNNDPKPEPFLQPPINLLTAPPRLSPELMPVHTPVSVNVSSTTPAVTTQPPLQPKPQPTGPGANTLDLLTSLMPGAESSRSMEYSYSVDNENSNPSAPVISSTAPPSVSGAAGVVASGGDVNVAELLQKLMATGIMPSLAPSQPKDRKVPEKPAAADSVLIKPVDFRKPDSLKIRQPALISHLYSGIQCNSCGVRFPPEQTMKYSQHLDWHFRQNRRDRDSSRTAQSRRYYYDVNDWVQFEEIEDLEERAQPWFEMQEGGEEEPPPLPLSSVCAATYPEDASCVICHDKFESFYNEEKEEWHLRNALDHEGSLVHPLCLEDQKAAAEKPIILDDIDITGDDNEVSEVKEDDKTEPGNTESEKKEDEEEVTEVAKPELDDDILEVKDLEVIQPVFPVEDLTVSDSEDVVDDEEPKKADTTPENEKQEDNTAMDTTEPQEEKEENKDDEEKEETLEIRDESSQDDLIMMEKGENSMLSNEEIMEVVKNIKKDPDALGGEFEDVGDEAKKDKGAVPVPAPVVDTTHTSVTSLIDGNVEFEETPQQMSVGGPPRIKINITKAVVKQPLTKEKDEFEDIKSPEALNEEESNPQRSKFTILNQPPPPGEECLPQNMKPRLYENKHLRKELPVVSKGTEMSGLCSIM